MAQKPICRVNGFYLVRPRANSDLGDVATGIAGLKGVDRVHVTEGDYGFVVVMRPCSDRDRRLVLRRISEVARTESLELTGHYIYRKRKVVRRHENPKRKL